MKNESNGINPLKVLEGNIRQYAQQEGNITEAYMRNQPSSHPDKDTSETKSYRAFILAQIDIAECALRNTSRELASLRKRKPSSGSLFEEQLKTLEKTYGQACDGYVHNPETRYLMTREIARVWEEAKNIVDRLDKKKKPHRRKV